MTMKLEPTLVHSATLLSCLADAGIASRFIPGLEMRTEVASSFHTFTLVDT